MADKQKALQQSATMLASAHLGLATTLRSQKLTVNDLAVALGALLKGTAVLTAALIEEPKTVYPRGSVPCVNGRNFHLFEHRENAEGPYLFCILCAHSEPGE